MFQTFQQDLDPVGGSLALSALCAALPLLTLFILLGGLKMKAWQAGLISLVAALLVAVTFFKMPVGQAIMAGAEGATFGFFPIMWIVVNAIWIYNLTVATGHFEVLKRSFGSISEDQRIQALIIAFCFGALLEALAGFGTPVAITVVMLMAVGFKPIKAATVALIANTAPVAFGAMASPIAGLEKTSGIDAETLGAMVGRQTPILAVFVPLILVLVVDGRRGLRQTWPVALVCGLAFGIAQFVAANYISVPLADIVASLVATAAIVGLLRVWQPQEQITATADATSTRAEGQAGSAGTSAVLTATGNGSPQIRDSRAEVVKAYAPYLVIIAIFAFTNISAVKEALAQPPWTLSFQWPSLDVANPDGTASGFMTFGFGWLPAAGTLLVFAGVITALILRVSPSTAIKTYVKTYVELRSAIITVMAVLGLAYVMNLSGQTGSLGELLAQTGSAFAIISPILGWIGVAVTGSDTSANTLFGALQVKAATAAGLDPTLMAAANSSGGVLGKMVSPQNLAIAAAAVGMAGKEGEIFRKVLGWSLLMLVFMCALVGLQATPVLSWMVP
ncbi:L-lactate permease [Nocardioides albus]|uniref:L-lactate permease n=1 Tax=Nocardioides albus TaxID=1841 RepID=A0A7W5A3D5_9ACTN|nr:L-lactate permease [Nocardioides albus]MBB3088951.1 lactate permease [Nocardioides albus]GGU15281.1 L-lactate permease [Nocardioides albus]